MSNQDRSATVDDKIYACLDLERPKSFFLFAGAGSGKTKSLENAMIRFKSEKKHLLLKLKGQKIAIITYTNVACDEINKRLKYDATFSISTIHSFAWELIKPFQVDIKAWMKEKLKNDIAELEGKSRAGRPGTKTAIDREKQIGQKKQRLGNIDKIKKFTYNPNGTNSDRDSLNHSEVINMTADFLLQCPLMKRILIKQYPVLLIDEAQDTKKELMDAFLNVQKQYSDQFVLGIFGDTMQRIYNDGKIDLGPKSLPSGWEVPEKTINYRCPKRIVKLINKIRSKVDQHVQVPVGNQIEGVVSLFIVDTRSNVDKIRVEADVAEQMFTITRDEKWSQKGFKVLTLEHHMAAKRGGFFEFFQPLYMIDTLKTGLLDGTLSGVSFLTQKVLPLVLAKRVSDEFKVARIIREYSPIFDEDAIKNSKDPLGEIRKANTAMEEIYALWANGQDPILIDVLKKVKEQNLFVIPDDYSPIIYRTPEQQNAPESDEEQDAVIGAWETALNVPFSQLEEYASYISDKSRYGTHQGVKGLEYPHVMVVIDDEEARGFMFKYNKLLGAEGHSEQDRRNESEGKETSIDRTRRLFYVTCSRARNSLAIIAYTTNVETVKDYAISQDWFSDDEIIVL